MLEEAHYEAALNYFYYLLMDEGASLHSALRAVKAVQKKQKKNHDRKIDHTLIEEMSSILNGVLKKNHPSKGNPAKSDWKSPDTEALGSWKDYLRRSDPKSAEALVLHYILNYSVDDISKALSVPEGTIYFRLGRGLEAFAGGKF